VVPAHIFVEENLLFHLFVILELICCNYVGFQRNFELMNIAHTRNFKPHPA
jgi:hypothetical protein